MRSESVIHKKNNTARQTGERVHRLLAKIAGSAALQLNGLSMKVDGLKESSLVRRCLAGVRGPNRSSRAATRTDWPGTLDPADFSVRASSSSAAASEPKAILKGTVRDLPPVFTGLTPDSLGDIGPAVSSIYYSRTCGKLLYKAGIVPPNSMMSLNFWPTFCRQMHPRLSAVGRPGRAPALTHPYMIWAVRRRSYPFLRKASHPFSLRSTDGVNSTSGILCRAHHAS